jgi:hypothetical protein
MDPKNQLSNEVELTKKLIEKREAIKHKLNLLKQHEITQENAFFPITKRLETIADQLQNKDPNTSVKKEKLIIAEPTINQPIEDVKFSKIKKKIDFLKEDEIKPLEYENLRDNNAVEISTLKQEEVEASENPFEDLGDQSVEENRKNIEEVIDTDVYNNYLKEFHKIPRQYIDEMNHDKKKQFDHRTGIRHDSLNKTFYIGASEVRFDGSDINVDGKLYKGTSGLYELLFKNNPKKYLTQDVHTYKEILDISNACRTNVDPNGQIQGSRSDKYKSIIAPLYFQSESSETPRKQRKTVGKGMFKEVNNNPIDYVYWDDPNELVDRLKLLVASQTAGHTGHTNEIVSLIEELQEAHIIEPKDDFRQIWTSFK